MSNEAQNDLEDIWLYTLETWSTEQADRYYNLLLNEMEYVTEHPNSGKDYSHVRKGYRRSNIKAHFILYKINEKENQIEIIRILHRKMDIEHQLNN